MTIVWLFWWMLNAAPDVGLIGSWNAWGIALVVSIVIDAGAVISWIRREKEGPYLHAFGRTYRPRQGWTGGEPDSGTRR